MLRECKLFWIFEHWSWTIEEIWPAKISIRTFHGIWLHGDWKTSNENEVHHTYLYTQLYTSIWVSESLTSRKEWNLLQSYDTVSKKNYPNLSLLSLKQVVSAEFVRHIVMASSGKLKVRIVELKALSDIGTLLLLRGLRHLQRSRNADVNIRESIPSP